MADRLIDKTKGPPVNRTAALVTQQAKPGFDDTKHIDPTRIHSEVPLPTKDVPPEFARTPRDLSGNRYGRLVVQGMLDPKAVGDNRARKRRRAAKWVVRCDCGRFEVRTGRALHNEANREDRCEACWKLANMKRHRDHLDGQPDKDAWGY